jgi:hypothetical protein
MTERTAIKTALALLHLPAGVRRVRAEPLPADIDVVLRIASADDEAIAMAAALTERPREIIQQAAEFYIEQVLLDPTADHYRVLGATIDAPTPTLRRNMALLLTWLHPDRNPSGDRAALVARITQAWDTLRNTEKRQAYDTELAKHRSMPTKRRSPYSVAKGNGATPPHAALKKQPTAGRHVTRPNIEMRFADEHRTLFDKGVDLLRKLLRT